MTAAIDHGFLPSGKYVINHDIMHCTAPGVAGNHLYSGRALGMSEPWDIIQLHPDLRRHWKDITEHYRRIGLSHSENVIWDLDLNQLGAHVGYHPSVFFFGPHECRYWGDHAWWEAVDFINSKNNFIQIAYELGVDVPETQCFDSVGEIGFKQVREFAYPCYLKAAISVSGVGIYRCENSMDFVQALHNFGLNEPVQVQREVATDTFLNLQYRVTGNQVAHLVASEQVLSGFAHQGNRVPARHEPWDMVDPMAEWLKDRGMKGIFAFDIAVVQTDHGLRFKAIECNPRFNGATYPTMITQKLDIPEWTAITFSTRHRRLADIDLQGVEFDMKTGRGAIIVNWGTIDVGKLMILMAGPQQYQETLETMLKARL